MLLSVSNHEGIKVWNTKKRYLITQIEVDVPKITAAYFDFTGDQILAFFGKKLFRYETKISYPPREERIRD